MDNNDFNFGDINLDDPDGGFDLPLDDSGQGGMGVDDFGFDTQASGNAQVNDGSDFFDSGDDGDADDLTDDQRSALNKKYMIIAAGGILIVLLTLFIGSRVLGSKKDNSDALTAINTQQNTNTNTNVDVSNIMSNGNTQSQQSNTQNQQGVSVNYYKDENGFSWMEITKEENVVFETEYSERIFTITTVKHYARTVDSANNLVLKTTLTGSISGLPGTYTIEVPYSKGVKLEPNNSFSVNVQIGTYNDKIVVGDITY